jgi:alpha/beta superfamily hydrolase
MQEENITITGGEVELEGRFVPGEAGGVVVTHPHPLFGGSMSNNVVWTACRAFQARGFATLRFNFRGVGRSRGAYGGGQEETADIRAALAYLETRTPEPHYLAGYSFGAYVAVHALLEGAAFQGAILISPPIAFMELDCLPQAPRVRAIVVGDQDDLCPLARLQGMWDKAVGPIMPEIIILPDADHFYGGREEALYQVLRHLSLAPPAR